MRVFDPLDVDVRLHEYVTVAAVPPVGVVSVQLSVPSDTVTVPVIATEPLERVTLTFTAYATPTVDGSGVSEVIVVVVDPRTVNVPVPVTVPPVPLAWTVNG